MAEMATDEAAKATPVTAHCVRLLSLFVTVGGSHLLLALLQELHLLVNLLNGVLQTLQLHLQRLQIVLCKSKRNATPCNAAETGAPLIQTGDQHTARKFVRMKRMPRRERCVVRAVSTQQQQQQPRRRRHLPLLTHSLPFPCNRVHPTTA